MDWSGIVYPTQAMTSISVICHVRLVIRARIRQKCEPDAEKERAICSDASGNVLPWQAPVRMLGMKPLRQGWGWAGHISHG